MMYNIHRSYFSRCRVIPYYVINLDSCSNSIETSLRIHCTEVITCFHRLCAPNSTAHAYLSRSIQRWKCPFVKLLLEPWRNLRLACFSLKAKSKTMASKRKAAAMASVVEEAIDPNDELMFLCLGGGNEVGRSCHILQYKGKTVMVSTILTYMDVSSSPCSPSLMPVCIRHMMDSLRCPSMMISISALLMCSLLASKHYFLYKQDFGLDSHLSKLGIQFNLQSLFGIVNE